MNELFAQVGIYNTGHTHTIRRKRQGCYCGGSISVLLALYYIQYMVEGVPYYYYYGSIALNKWF